MTNAAARYLERFPASSSRLRSVLRRKAARAEGDRAELDGLIEEVVVEMESRGLVDDARYARGLAASLHDRGLSSRRISMELAKRGVSSELAGTAVAELLGSSANADLAAAWTLAKRRRLGPFRGEATREAFRQRDLGVLARAGFSYALAKRVIDSDGLDESEGHDP
ncbi:MAG: RecX family transcriptional regulator [Deltaproteobacteria bacterium]|nr:RecX family transcriptional regulator [Deltaproteobacteria bacterium]